MKSIDKGQLLFLLIASLPVAWLIASVAVYPLNGVGLIQLLKTWPFGMLWQVLTDSHIRHDIWFNGIKSLGVGLCGSGLLITGLIVSTDRQSRCRSLVTLALRAMLISGNRNRYHGEMRKRRRYHR